MRGLWTWLPMLILSGVVTKVASASPTDGKNYAGCACRAWSGVATDFFCTIQNQQQTTLYVDCPAIRDQAPPNGVQSGYIQVIDQHSTQGVECTLFMASLQGSSLILFSQGPQSSAGSSTAMQQINITFAHDGVGDWYWVGCSVPPVEAGVSELVMYHLDESACTSVCG